MLPNGQLFSLHYTFSCKLQASGSVEHPLPAGAPTAAAPGPEAVPQPASIQLPASATLAAETPFPGVSEYEAPVDTALSAGAPQQALHSSEVGASIRVLPLDVSRAETASPALIPEDASTPGMHLFSNTARTSPLGSAPEPAQAASAGVDVGEGQQLEPASGVGSAPEGSKMSWSGNEKFNTVQEILDHNKCAF